MKKRQGSGLAQSDFEKASEFNGQFTDVFTKSEHSQFPLLDRSAPFMEDIVVTKEGVTKLLKGLNPSKALGPDELHPRVLKELATELGPVFAHLFQQSIDKGEIPKEWSLANICPLFKKGDRSLACNYRPVWGGGGGGGVPIRGLGGGGGGSKVWGRWVMWGYGGCKPRIKGIDKCK